ncbi:MAG: hypothetical protein JSW28_00330 [Thermoplasmata archaeon]|nr:MAG: hypothetical protein JSW28_00330 [Thermoplasmata archaeon]
MAWKIGMLEDEDIVSVVTSGIMDKGHIIQMCAETIAFGRERGTSRYLVDHRKMAPGSYLSSMDIDRLPLLLNGVGEDRRNRVAVVISPENQRKDDSVFFESVVHNRGCPLKVFTGKNPALEWLTQE